MSLYILEATFEFISVYVINETDNLQSIFKLFFKDPGDIV